MVSNELQKELVDKLFNFIKEFSTSSDRSTILDAYEEARDISFRLFYRLTWEEQIEYSIKYNIFYEIITEMLDEEQQSAIRLSI